MNKQGISLCLLILTLLLCHCNSSGRRRYTRPLPYGKRNYAKILKVCRLHFHCKFKGTSREWIGWVRFVVRMYNLDFSSTKTAKDTPVKKKRYKSCVHAANEFSTGLKFLRLYVPFTRARNHLNLRRLGVQRPLSTKRKYGTVPFDDVSCQMFHPVKNSSVAVCTQR